MAVAAVLLVAGCADQPKKQDIELGELVDLVAGHYDTIAQVRSEGAQGAAPREALLLAIVPVRATLIGDAVFYMQESAANDPRRVISQQLLSFQVAQGVPVLVASPLALVEPGRWRDGDRNPDLFRSVLPQDIRPLGGCEITWRKVAGGFDGATDPSHCRGSSRATGEALHVEQKYALRAGSLTIAERRVDGTGVQVEVQPPLQFQRRME